MMIYLNMPEKCRSYAAIMKALLLRDLFVLRTKLFDLFINSTIVLGVEMIIWLYLYPAFGVDYRVSLPLFFGFPLLSLLFNLGFGFSMKYTFGAAYQGYGDLEYHLTLPLPSICVFTAYVLSFWIESFLVTVPLIAGALLFLHSIGGVYNGSLALFFFFYAIVVFLIGFIFLAASFHYPFAWFKANMWPRRIGPLIVVGATFYPWYKVYEYSPKLAYVMLANPVTYICEGLRAALFGSNGSSLPVAGCLLIVITVLCLSFVWMKQSVKKRLDLI